MSSSSSGLWVAALVALGGSGAIAACASSPTLQETPTPWDCATAGCSDSGAQSPDESNDAQSPDNSNDAEGNGSDDTGVGQMSNDSGVVSSTKDAGPWINMTNNATGCQNEPNVPCGYTMGNEGQGYTCACREGMQAEGWTCEPPGYAVIAGPSCPGVVSSGDASTGDDDSGTANHDSGTSSHDSGTGAVDAGWIDFMTDPNGCANLPGAPCGYTTDNEGQMYVCVCYNVAWAQPWACEPAGTAAGVGCN